MYATHGMRVAFLETLNQLSVLDVSNSPDLSGAVTIKVEQHPKKIFLGPNHVGCLRENEIVFYKLNKQNPSIVNKVVLINSTDVSVRRFLRKRYVYLKIRSNSTWVNTILKAVMLS